MHNHLSAKNYFPLGALTSPRRTFIIACWPYLENKSLFDAYEMGVDWQLSTANKSLVKQPVPMYYCPSDPAGATPAQVALIDNVERARCNYVANEGQWPESGVAPLNSTYSDNTSRRAMYAGMFMSHSTKVKPYSPKPFSASSVSDGLSKTLCMAEVLIPTENGSAPLTVDSRADAFDTKDSHWAFHTSFTPNGSTVDRPERCGPLANRPEINMPCVANTQSTFINHAARSRHPGTVQVLMGDGAVRSVTDNVDATTWKALGTSGAGDTIGDY